MDWTTQTIGQVFPISRRNDERAAKPPVAPLPSHLQHPLPGQFFKFFTNITFSEISLPNYPCRDFLRRKRSFSELSISNFNWTWVIYCPRLIGDVVFGHHSQQDQAGPSQTYIAKHSANKLSVFLGGTQSGSRGGSLLGLHRQNLNNCARVGGAARWAFPLSTIFYQTDASTTNLWWVPTFMSSKQESFVRCVGPIFYTELCAVLWVVNFPATSLQIWWGSELCGIIYGSCMNGQFGNRENNENKWPFWAPDPMKNVSFAINLWVITVLLID